MPHEISKNYYRQCNEWIHNETIHDSDDDDDDDYFHPLVYCAITMDEGSGSNGTKMTSNSRKYKNNEQLIYKSNHHTTTVHGVQSKTDNNNAIKFKDIPHYPNQVNNKPSTQVNAKDGNNNNNKTQKKKSYTCEYCNKIFGWSTDLKRHILIHTGERPFKCSVCPASFTRNFLLQKHKSKIHHCLTPLELSILDDNVAENLKEIKSKMIELEREKNRQLFERKVGK